ncbi:MAG: hypothetical protein ACLFTE_05220 [Salinivenus sp.]
MLDQLLKPVPDRLLFVGFPTGKTGDPISFCDTGQDLDNLLGGGVLALANRSGVFREGLPIGFAAIALQALSHWFHIRQYFRNGFSGV